MKRQGGSPTSENYIKTIYLLEEAHEEGLVKTKAIAEALHTAQPLVTSMIKSLAQKGYIDYRPYYGVKITPKGRQYALKIIRKHRLIEVFLIKHLKMGWDEVHEEAEVLEHALSDKVADRLDAFLGYPSYDPHGDPIPDSNGHLPSRQTLRLSKLKPTAKVIIAQVLDQTPEFLRYLEKRHLIPGQSLTLVNIEPFDGLLQAKVNGEDLYLSKELAHKLLVSIVKDEDS